MLAGWLIIRIYGGILAYLSSFFLFVKDQYSVCNRILGVAATGISVRRLGLLVLDGWGGW